MEPISALALLAASPFVGSFLGTLILRLPADRPVVGGRSQCDACGERLGVRDLVPLLSWATARGRCRHCGTALSPFYPAIELAAVAVAAWCLAIFPPELLWPSALLGWTLLALAEIDRRHFWLPDRLVLPLIAFGLVVRGWQGSEPLITGSIGAAAGYLSLSLIDWTYRRLRGRPGLGQGDAKLFAAAGAWSGWAGLPEILLIGAFASILLAFLRTGGRGVPSADTAVPFGPGLAVGTWLVWSFGPVFISA
ncbi:MAG: prepilin peptidase [Rhodospirillaceae bacterium]|nr:prepilin peptidase [Rhodospirillaceae bacterium]